MVLMLDLKSLAQQSAVLPNLAEKNEILTIVLGCLAILHSHVNYLFVVAIFYCACAASTNSASLPIQCKFIHLQD